MTETSAFSLQMRSEWEALRSALDACVEEHAKRQEQLIASLSDDARLRNSGGSLRQDARRPSKERARKEQNSSSTVEPRNSGDDLNGATSSRKVLQPRQAGSAARASKSRQKSFQAVPPPLMGWDDGSSTIANKIKRIIYKRCFKCIDWWMQLKEPRRTGRLARFVHSGTFESVCAAVILTNGVFAAIAANLEEESAFMGMSGRPFSIFLGEMFFIAFYSFELGLKLICHGWYFFVNEDMYWNLFDTVLVAFTLYDEGSVMLMGASIGANVSFMRTLRILKMAKILRVVRVMRYFQELRLILQSLVGSLTSLFWSIVMIALIFYIFALCFVQGVTAYLMETNDNPIQQARDDLQASFGNVQDTMLTLYKASTGGDDWSQFYKIIAKTGGMYSTLFIFFVAFIQIALFNILTAIFVENAMKLAQPDRDAKALEVRKAEEQEKEALRKVCKSLDTNDDGSLDVQEFYQHLQHGKLRAYLSVLGLEVRDAEMFLKVLSAAAQDAPIEIEAFVEGCMRMKGHASSIDMQGLMFETKIIHKSLKQLYREMLEQFAGLAFTTRASNNSEATTQARKQQLMSAVNPRSNITGQEDSTESDVLDYVSLERESLEREALFAEGGAGVRLSRIRTEGSVSSQPMTL